MSRHIDELCNAAAANIPPRAETTRWIAEAPERIAKRLISYGLASESDIKIQGDEGRFIAAFMDHYIANRDGWAKRSTINYSQSRDWLIKFVGTDKTLRDFTRAEGERWYRWMLADDKLASTTASQHVKRCRQMLKHAVEDGLLDKNPLLGMKTAPDVNREKDFYVTPELTVQLIDEAPNAEWRLVIALVRYGGLRCPSEVLKLRWTDILWDKSRIIVNAPKTERYVGKDQRIIPIFPRLRPHLEYLFNERQPGIETKANAFVIRQYRSQNANLRTELNRIVFRTGNQPWDKPFINMRASCRTELENTGKYATHVLNAWFGHSTAIAHKHYLQVTEDDYARATGEQQKTTHKKDTAEATQINGGVTGGDICANQDNPADTAEVGTPSKNPCLTSLGDVQHGYQYTPEES